MFWFLLIQGLAIAALGVWGLTQSVIPIAGGVGLVVFGLLWGAMALFAMRFQRKTAALRRALAATDPEARAQDKKQRRLSWLQWGLFVAGIVWIAITARIAGPNELWPLYGAGALFAVLIGVMLYRMFITANLDATASNTLTASLGGRVTKRFLGKSGSGTLAVVGIVLVFAGIIADEYANLPFKFMSLLWYALGLTILWAVGSVAWHFIRRRLPKRQE